MSRALLFSTSQVHLFCVDPNCQSGSNQHVFKDIASGCR